MKRFYNSLKVPSAVHLLQRVLLLLTFVLFSQGAIAQTIDFEEITDANNTDIGAVYTSGNFRFTVTNGSFIVSGTGTVGAKGLKPQVLTGAGLLTIETIDGSEFQFESFYIDTEIFGTLDFTSIEGFKNGVSTGSEARLATRLTTEMSAFLVDVDKVVLNAQFFGFSTYDDFVFSAASETANVAPLVTAPTAPTVTEDATDVAIEDDIQLVEADLEDSHTLTFTITGGTLSLGESGITFGGSGNKSASFTAQGSVADLNTAMDAATFTPTPDLSGADAATISFVANDGKTDSNTATVTFDITGINDIPVFTSSPETSVDQDKKYSYTITASDNDQDGVLIKPTTKPDWLSLQASVNTEWVVNTFAGSGSFGLGDGTGTSATFIEPQGITIDASGTLYIADEFKIRKINPNGVVTTLAGADVRGRSDGTGTNAKFQSLKGLTLDASGNLYVCDIGNYNIVKVTPEGVVTTFAGSGTSVSVDGTGTLASFVQPVDLDIDNSGNLYVGDGKGNTLRKITPDGVVTTLAGSSTAGTTDGTGSAAGFNSLDGIKVDDAGTIYVADWGNHRIRKVSPQGVVTTLAGSGATSSIDGTGTAASFYRPVGLTLDAAGNLFVSEQSGRRIRKVTPEGIVSTIAGNGTNGALDGPGTSASFSSLGWLDFDAHGNLYVADRSNLKIRSISPQSYTLSGDASAEKGSHAVTLNANDLKGGSATQSFSIFVSDVVEFDATTSNASESESAADIPVSISKALTTEASVDYSITGTAQNGSDYTLTAGTLTFAAGDRTKNITITGISDDTEIETNETIILTLSNAVGIDLGNQNVHTYTINDNDVSAANAGADQTVCGTSLSLSGNAPDAANGETGAWSIISGENGFLQDATNANTSFSGRGGITYTLRWTLSKGEATSSDDVQIALVSSPFANAGPDKQVRGLASLEGTVSLGSTGTWTIQVGDGNGVLGDPTSLTSTFTGTPGIWYTLVLTASNDLCGSNTDGVDIQIEKNELPEFITTPGNTVNDNTSYRYLPLISDKDDAPSVTATTKPDWLTLSSLPAASLHTFAGASASGNNNGFATDARFSFPIDVALDAEGNVFVVEEINNQVRKISADGQVSTFATGLNFPAGITIDASGNVYVADTHNHLIKKITKEGVVTTLAAGINQPYGIAVDAQGVVYATSIIDNTIHKVSTSGQVTTLAGTGNFGSNNGTGTEAGFSYPAGLALDATGNIYVADWGNNRVRQITPAGVVTTVAGSNTQASTDGAGAAASFDGPRGITVDADGIIYVTENNSSSNRIRKIQGGNVSTLASTLPSATNILVTPEGLTVDKLGNIYVADVRNHSIKILPAQAQPVLSGSAVGQKGTNDVTLKADDGHGGVVEQSFTITVNDVTDPVFTSATAVDFAENGTGAAYTITATDASEIAYSLGTGNDEGLFDINAGVITFKTSPDFENPADANTDNTYVINVMASDGTNSVNQDVTITVTNANESPAFTSSPVTSVNDNASYSYKIEANDPEEDALTITATTKPDWLSLAVSEEASVSTIAGSGVTDNNGTGVPKDGIGTEAGFGNPGGIAIDASGNIYVLDATAAAIRKVDTNKAVTTIAGNGINEHKDGSGTDAGFLGLNDIALDPQGNLYVTSNHSIRKMTPEGVVSTFAGPSNGAEGDMDGTGAEARFSAPVGITYDATTNALFVADARNRKIRKVTLDGVVSTFAGSGESGSDDGSGTNATFNSPQGITVDIAGNFYVADANNNTIRKITTAGEVTTLAGSTSGFNDGSGTAAQFAYITSLTVDNEGVVYVADGSNNAIRQISPEGVVSTLLGGSSAYVDGTFDVARLSSPQKITIDNNQNLVFNEWSRRLRRVNIDRGTRLIGSAVGQTGTHNVTVTANDGTNQDVEQSFTITVKDVTAPVISSATTATFAENGTGTAYTATATDANTLTYSLGTGNDESLFEINGASGAVTFKSSPDFENPIDANTDNAYVINVIASDGTNSVNQDVTITVTNVDDTDPVFTSATTADFAENGTGTAYTATATDANALTYSLGSGNDEALFDIAGGVVTFKTSPDFESPGDANKDNAYVINVTVDDGVNSVGQLVTITVTNVNEAPAFISSAVTSVDDNATYNYAIAADDSDGDNLTITAITKPDWLTLSSTVGNEVTTLAGSGSASSTNGTGVQASFNEPRGIAVDAAGNVYVSESQGNIIRKITPNGEVTTLAGSGSSGSANGTGTEASFSTPQGVAVDASGNVYVADFGNNLIRKITSAGVVTTFAGSGTAASDNGPGTFASFNAPIGVAVDAANNVYVATFTGNLIRKISSAGVVTTLAGSGDYGNSNGNGTDASFFLPQNLAVDISGNVYVVGAQLVRKITPNGDVTTLAGSGTTGKVNANGTNASFTTPSGVSVDASGNVFIADSSNDLIRKITPNGDVTTLAGSGSKGSTNADGLAASFDFPNAIAVDASGNLYVTDLNNHLIRKISTTSHLLSGDATGQSGTHEVTLKADDGNGKTVEQNFTITVNDATDPVFTSATTADFAENGTGTAYTVTATDVNELTYSLGTANDESLFDIASGVVTFKAAPDFENPTDGDANNTYVINVIASDGINSVNQDVTITVTNVDDTDPIFTSATAVDFAENGTGTAYTVTATDANELTYSLGTGNDEGLFNINGGVITFKSTPDFECQADANTDNAYVISVIASDGINAANQEVTITVTNVDEAPEFLSVAVTSVDDNKDYGYNIRVSDQEGDNLTVTATTKPDWLNLTQDEPLSVSTIAGSGETDGNGTGVSKDGIGTEAAFGFPGTIVTDASGNIYMTDLVAGGIRKIDQNAVVTTIAGNTTYEHKDGIGTNASFSGLNDIALGPQGNLYIASESSIRKMTPEGVVSTLAGTSDGSTGYMDGTGSEARFSALSGITYDAATNALYVTDVRNARIRKVTLDGVVTTFAGSGTVGNDDGTAFSASFNNPQDIVVDSKGDFYVADTQSRRVRKITASGMVSTFAGSSSGFQNGKGTAAQFAYFRGMTIDNEDILYVADGENNRIRRINPEGIVSTLVGGDQGYIDGDINMARLQGPQFLAVDADQNLILSEWSLRLRRVKIDRGNQLKGSPVGQKGIFNVTLSLTDGTNDPVTQSFTVTVNDATKPVFTSTETAAFAENGTGTAYTALATDTNPVTYSLANDNDEALFNVVGSSGAVTFKAAPDFENPTDGDANNTYVINVIASDGINSVNQEVTITVTNVDDTNPVFTSATAVDFAENGTGTAYTVVATDANTLTFSLGTGNDESLFDIAAGVVTFKAAPDFENPADGDANNTYVINVIASDGINSVNQDVTITVTNVDDTDPVFTSVTAVDFAENGTGTAYTVTATDANTLTYSLGMGNDESLFDIAAGVVTFKSAPDFENPADGDANNTYVINVIASDGINAVNQDVTIAVTNVDDTDPVFTSATATDFVENATSTAYTVSATDANALTYSLGSGNDESLFDIAAGVVTFKTAPDFENPTDGDANNTYVINVIASDGINSVNQNVTITVTNVDDTDPVFTSAIAVDFVENATSTAYTVSATDANALTYSLGTGNDESLFDIAAGVVTFKTAPDFENPADGDANNTYVINVIASDGINAVNQDVTITVTNVDDTDPVFTSAAAVDFAENGIGTAYTATATDANTLTYGLGTGNDETLFTIDGSSGVVTFKTAPDFENPSDADANNTYVVNVLASDGINSVNQDVTVTVTDVDEIAPSVSITSTVSSVTSGLFTVTVEYSEVVTGFVEGDISVTNGTAGNFTSITAGKSWTADITPISDGTVTVNVAAATATDATGNANTAATAFSILNDEIAPTVVLSSGAAIGGVYTVTAQFSEIVSDFILGDVTVTDGTVGDFTAVDGDTYTFSVSSTNASASVDIAAAVATDAAGNGNSAAGQLTLSFNNTPTDISLSNTSIAENNEVGDLIGNFSTTDADATDSHAYALVTGAGDTDNAAFTIDGMGLRAAVAFDFETKESYSIRVKTDDGRGGAFEKNFTISINNVGEPKIELSGDVNFTETQLGITASTPITITNTGEVAVEVIASSAPTDFSVTPGSVILMAGESKQVNVNFTPTQEATYSGNLVFMYEDQQVSMSVSGIGAIVTGVDDTFIDSSEIRLYPNPASEILNIDLSQVHTAKLDITIINAAGTRVYEIREYREKQLSINVGDYNNGLYIMQFTDGKSVARKKVIIRK